MRKTIVIAVLVAVAGAGGYTYYVYTKKEPPPTVATAKVARGDIAETVGATGSLQAVTTVQVGTQVSGTVQQLNADFNSLVHKGQVIARLDPSLFQTQIEQARANLIRAQADLERLRVTVEDARTKLTRAQQLFDKKLISQTDLEAAQVAVRSADAQVRSQQAAVTQAQAALQQNQVNLEHTIITAPIDGLVISRNVDVGQTVAASMSAPTLFVLAADLTKMQVVASLDESDVGRIRPGQLVRFRVDAYPNQEFTGSVTQVRLQPQTVQNVVTYSTVIDVPNPELKLKPGMTANVNIEIARRNNVLRVPNSALRFRPTAEIFQALGQTPPAGGGGGFGGRGGRGGRGGGDNLPSSSESSSSQPTSQPSAIAGNGTASAPAQQSSETAPRRGSPPPATQGRQRASGGGTGASTDGNPRRGGRRNADQAPAGVADSTNAGGQGGSGGRGGGRGNVQERMANMTPEERQQFMDRMRARGFDPQTPTAGGNRAPSGRQAAANTSSASTIDQLFGPLPPTETVGQVWLFADGKLSRVPLRLGITDGQQTALIQGELQEGEEVVTSVTTAAQRAATNAGSTAFPGFQQGRGGFGGGGFGGAPRGGGARGGR